MEEGVVNPVKHYTETGAALASCGTGGSGIIEGLCAATVSCRLAVCAAQTLMRPPTS